MEVHVSSNAFIGKPEKPGDAELSSVLGPSRALWDQLLDDLSSEGSITGWEWHSYSVKAGWSLRLKRKQRNIVYMVPCQGAFLAAFVFGSEEHTSELQSLRHLVCRLLLEK